MCAQMFKKKEILTKNKLTSKETYEKKQSLKEKLNQLNFEIQNYIDEKYEEYQNLEKREKELLDNI